MPYYRNLRNGVVYKFASSHWANLSNQKDYEEVNSLAPDPKSKPTVKKKVVKKAAKKK